MKELELNEFKIRNTIIIFGLDKHLQNIFINHISNIQDKNTSIVHNDINILHQKNLSNHHLLIINNINHIDDKLNKLLMNAFHHDITIILFLDNDNINPLTKSICDIFIFYKNLNKKKIFDNHFNFLINYQLFLDSFINDFIVFSYKFFNKEILTFHFDFNNLYDHDSYIDYLLNQ